MKELKLILLSLYLAPLSLHAFLNVEALRLSKLKKDQTTGSLKLGLSDQNGNVDRQRYKLTSLNLFRKTKNSWISVVDYQYGESFKVEDTRQGKAHLRYTRQLSPLLASEIYSQIEFDDFKKLNSRKLIGAGPRLVKGYEDLKLSLGIGAFYEMEELDQSDDLENWRGNLYSSLLWNYDSVFSVNTTIYYQPKLDEFEDYRIQMDIGIETIFAKRFFQEFSYSLTKDTRPPSRVAKSDSSLQAQIGIRY